MTWNQKYGIASLLSCNTLDTVITRLQGCPNMIAWAKQADRYYRRRDGFVPRAVIRMVNAK